MNKTIPTRFSLVATLISALFYSHGGGAATDISQTPLSTYSAKSQVLVKPNILFVLDDSGSMSWNYMPDWANDNPPNYYTNPPYLFYNSGFNGIAYNPAIRYQPPIAINADGKNNLATYPSMDSAATSAWTSVPVDGYGVQSSSRSNLVDNAYYYTFIPGEFCNASNLRNCTTTNSATGQYAYPAPLRWCTGDTLTTCKATYDSDTGYIYPRAPAPRVSMVDFSGSSSTSVSGITVDGAQIMKAGTGSTTSSSSLASAVASQINGCTNLKAGNCTTAGYIGLTWNSRLYILAPGVTSVTPAVVKSGSMTVTATAFDRSNNPNEYYWDGSNGYASPVPGENLRVAISSSITNSYAYPGTAAKAPGRTDCAGTTCTYAEEMTNYANWYAYYRTRMQMMKTSMSRAFSTIDTTDDVNAGVSQYRLGFMTINNNGGSKFQNLGDFSLSNKKAWYDMLFSAVPNNSTPLRSALSQAGRLYGGKLTTLNGVSVTDPLQYSCQRNYTILSTDGFWNGGAGTKLDGSTSIGNQDAAYTGAYGDGGTNQWQSSISRLQTRSTQQTASKGTLQASTSQLQKSTSELFASTSQLYSSTSTLQQVTSTLQKSTSQPLQQTQVLYEENSANSGSTWGAKTAVATCTWDNSGSSRKRCSYSGSWSVSTPVATCTPKALGTGTSGTWNTGVQCVGYDSWTSPVTVSSCAPVNQGSGTSSWPTAVNCSYTAWTSPSPVSSCAPVTQSSGTGTWSVATARQCSYSAWTDPTPVASCVRATQSSGTGTWTVSTARQCTYDSWTAPQSVSSCTPVAQGTGTGTWLTATQCSYGAWTAPTQVSSCTPVAQGTGTSTRAPAVQCSYSAWTAWANASSCAAVTQSSGTGTWSNATARQCQYAWDAVAGTATCSPTYVAGNYTNPTVYKSCTTSTGAWVDATGDCSVNSTADPNGYTTACQYTAWSAWSNVSGCTATAQSTSSPYSVLSAQRCQSITSGGTSDTLADVAAYYYYNDLRRSDNASAATADRTGTCTGPIIPPSTTANDLCPNNVAKSGLDTNTAQHMVTYTLGLGAQGKMVYSDYQNDQVGNRSYTPNYWLQGSGDFYDVNQGNVTNSSTGVCSWQTSGKCSWPTPASDSNANIDDLWHAAVNGRGTYFSASDPDSLSKALASTLSAISKDPKPGAAAAAASSNPNITSTDNYIFSSSYRSVEWWGELVKQELNIDGTLSAQKWSAMQLLDCAKTPWKASSSYKAGSLFGYGTTCYLVQSDYTSGASFDAASVDTNNSAVIPGGVVTRKIYTPNSSRTNLINFDWGSLDGTQQSYFTLPYLAYDSGAGTGLTQFCTNLYDPACLPSARQSDNTTAGAAGAALVAYLAGERSHEGTDFRARTHILGDIVSAEARYVQKPMYNYGDSGYSGFKAAQETRKGVVYAASNDGMLHAFDSDNGAELWAFIPSAVLPQLYRLADMKYSDNHRFLVDGSPEVGDFCPSTSCSDNDWKTILVGGLNGGGNTYYALDITNPTSPKLLWEFTHSTMGLSYGNPRITKLSDGTWVVIFTSGYNNADGVGRIYVVNANTGQLVSSVNGTGIISTGVGTAASPSGLARISAHVRYPMTDNTVTAVYGGDLLGNLWRFDVNNQIAPSGYEAFRMITFTDASGKAQPVTEKPVTATVSDSTVVLVGTGRYLGTTDISNTDPQSFYGVKDVGTGSSSGATFTNPRTTGSGFVKQTLTTTTCSADAATTGACIQGESAITASNNTVSWADNNGWYIDFPTAGERSTTDPALGLGTLVFTTIKPNLSSDNPCGENAGDTSGSNIYFLDYMTGSAIPDQNNVVSTTLGPGIATRPVLIKDQSGAVRALVRQPGGTDGTDQGRTSVVKVKVKTGGSGGLKRVSWREINGE